MPSRRQIAEMLSSPLRPSKIILIFSSELNLRRVHMWGSLAIANGDQGKGGRDNRDIAESWMTPSQISTAKEMAAQCLQSNYKDCE
jgi:hypothetical protein